MRTLIDILTPMLAEGDVSERESGNESFHWKSPVLIIHWGTAVFFSTLLVFFLLL